MMKTAVERRKEAERELYFLLNQKKRSPERIEEALRSVLSTAEAVRTGPLEPKGNHQGFAEAYVDAYQGIAATVMKMLEHRAPGSAIYNRIRLFVEKRGLDLSTQPVIVPDVYARTG